MVRRVNLDEEKHAFRILQQMNQMKQDQRQCDFVVTVDEHEFHTHRNILSAGSDYFNAMLTHDTKEKQLGKVEMMDVDPECVKICINYIYTGKADIPDEKIEQLIHVTSVMQLDMLKQALAITLEEDLNVDSFYSTRKLAESYGLESLLAKCKEFELNNILMISSQPGFKNEQRSHIAEILASESTPMAEDVKLILSVRWVRHTSGRSKYFTDLLKSINLKKVAPGYLRHLVNDESFVKDSLKIYRALTLPLLDLTGIESQNCEAFYEEKSLLLFDIEHDCLTHFNPRKNKIKLFRVANFHIPDVYDFSAICLGQFLYILGDDSTVHRLHFNNNSSEWERVEDMLSYHGYCPPVTSFNASIYVIGGYKNWRASVIMSASERFIPSENRWVKLENRPEGIAGASLVALDGSIYSVAGLTHHGVSNLLFRYDLNSSEWTELEPMQQARSSCGAVSISHKIYVFGGSDDRGEVLKDMDCYDIVTNQWTKLPPMIGCHDSILNAHHIDGSILAIERMESSATIEKYDLEKNEWCKEDLGESAEFEIYDSVAI